MQLKAPFPWFGGKSRVAHEVWRRFGEVKNYVEPFFGSGAVLLGRPGGAGPVETVNDKDGFVANFWRALARDPGEVEGWASEPVNENDLHAKHTWLLEQKKDLAPRLEADPDWFDARVAGYWVWGVCAWIGSGFCSGNGPWVVEDGRLVKSGSGGVHRQLPHLGTAGKGINSRTPTQEWFSVLASRLECVRVCCGDWSRVCGPSVTHKHGLTGVFLDPPYADTASRCDGLYAEDSMSVAHDVREWAIANGDNPKMRIALCGYEGEHEMPGDWSVFAWKTQGGFSTQSKDKSNQNKHRERIWFSPACLGDVC